MRARGYLALAGVALWCWGSACGGGGSSGGAGSNTQSLGNCQSGYDHLTSACGEADAKDWAAWCLDKAFYREPGYPPCTAETQALIDCYATAPVWCGPDALPGDRIDCGGPWDALWQCLEPTQ
jgi:hypothetical protein